MDELLSTEGGTVQRADTNQPLLIGGCYEVVRKLGAGLLGSVYLCRHRELQDNLVAVKVIFPDAAQEKRAAACFHNEIFASLGVSHPNVLRTHEYLRDQDGDLIGYTMEYVGGGNLANRLATYGDVPISEVIRIMSEMCNALQAIHDAGIVHRDLEPENILFTRDGTVKISDFGVARMGDGPMLAIEDDGLAGTIDYVSPEYMLDSKVDLRSDIYSLGMIAYEMTTRESISSGDSIYSTMVKRLKTDPAPPSSIRKDCPAALDSIILKALSRDPEQRHQKVSEILDELEKVAIE